MLREIRETIGWLRGAPGSRPLFRGIDQYSSPESHDDARHIQQILATRRLRNQQLGSTLFADPAWDMLLEAYAAALCGRRVVKADLVHASTLQESTALRWIAVLEQHGWLKRSGDSQQADRHASVEVTTEAMMRLGRFFELAGSTGVFT